MIFELHFKSNLLVLDSNVYGLHIPVPDEVYEHFSKNKDLRVIFSVNGADLKNGALLSAKKYWYLLVNKSDAKQWRIQVGQEVKVAIAKDDSKYGMPMPDEFQEALNQDAIAAKYFDALTAGKKRTLLHLVGKVKNSQSRINKSLAILEHLVEVKGALDFKAMNQKIKDFNIKR